MGAKIGMQQLEKSEAQLHRDLNGHRDSDLERDIENKAEEIESQQSATTEQTSSEDSSSSDGVQADFSAPTKLGESQNPSALEAAEMAAEVALDKSSQLDTSAEYSTDDEVEPQAATGSVDTSAEYSTDDEVEPQAATGSVSDNFQAIGDDAEQLVAYQKNSLKEIAQIEEPLQ